MPIHNLQPGREPGETFVYSYIQNGCWEDQTDNFKIIIKVVNNQVISHYSQVLNLSRGREIDVNQSTERSFCPKNTYFWPI